MKLTSREGGLMSENLPAAHRTEDLLEECTSRGEPVHHHVDLEAHLFANLGVADARRGEHEKIPVPPCKGPSKAHCGPRVKPAPGLRRAEAFGDDDVEATTNLASPGFDDVMDRDRLEPTAERSSRRSPSRTCQRASKPRRQPLPLA